MKNIELVDIATDIPANLAANLVAAETEEAAFAAIMEYNSKIIGEAPIGANIDRDWAATIKVNNIYYYQLNIAVITDGTEKVGDKTFSEMYIKASDDALWFTGKDGRRRCDPHKNKTNVFFLVKENNYSKNWNSIPV